MNSITLGGVGSQTVIDHIQISYSNDDAIEWFGGTVNCKYLIAYKTLDDDFDTDNGYNGRVQFGIILRDSGVADISKVECFESDNDAAGSSLTPQTAPVFSNITVIGPRATAANVGNAYYLAAAQIRRNSSLSLFILVIMGWPVGVYIDATKGVPVNNNIPYSLFIQNSIIADCAEPVKYSITGNTNPPQTPNTTQSILTWFNTPAYGNSILQNNTDVGLGAPFNYANPDFNPTASSAAATGASFSHVKLNTGFNAVTYRGACTVGNTWWKGWTKFN